MAKRKRVRGLNYETIKPKRRYTLEGVDVFDEQIFPKIPKEMFERALPMPAEKESVNDEDARYWSNAWARLKKDKKAVLAMLVFAFICLMSIIGPYMNDYEFDEQIKPIRSNNRMPPRIPLVEKIGIFDGSRITEVGENRLGEYREGEYEILAEYNLSDESGAQKRYKIKEYTYVKNKIEDKYYWFGTDDLARDSWTRIWRGTRISVFVGVLVALIDTLIGVSYGAIAGFNGGKIDTLMMRFTELIGGVPWLVVVLLFTMVFGNGLLAMSIAIAFSSWIGMARVVRAQSIKLRESEFVLAAKTLGTTNSKLITRHLIPNIGGQILVVMTFSIPAAIFTEAFLAFLGLGIPPPFASLGSVISDSRKYLEFYPSMIFIPSAIISLLILSVNIFANALRDALDPRLKDS